MSGTLPKLSAQRRAGLRGFTETELRSEVRLRQLERCTTLELYQKKITQQKNARNRAESRKNMLGVAGFDALASMGDGKPKSIADMADWLGKAKVNAARIMLCLYRHGLLSREESPPRKVGRPFNIYTITHKGKLRLVAERKRGREPGVPYTGRRRPTR